jgi:hypothetical protein
MMVGILEARQRQIKVFRVVIELWELLADEIPTRSQTDRRFAIAIGGGTYFLPPICKMENITTMIRGSINKRRIQQWKIPETI